MVKTEEVAKATARQASKAAPPSKSAPSKHKGVKITRKDSSKASRTTPRRALKVSAVAPVVIRQSDEPPEGLPKKYYLKSTFNTHDIMHSPVEKTLKMLDKILQGERLFTM